MDIELLTNEQMAMADRLAMSKGIAGLTLMENAGAAVAAAASEMIAPNPKGSSTKAVIAILCGPGNNGGDGFVAARLLEDQGYDVRLSLCANIDVLKGDAAVMAGRWTGETHDFTPDVIKGADIVIDAVFGAGLTRAIATDWDGAEVLRALNASDARILAVDVPSGMNGTTGEALGLVVQADKTITFFRKKPGHVLYPGRALCADVTLADIGIPKSVLPKIASTDAGPINTFINGPSCWLKAFPAPNTSGHKYERGHAVAVSGPAYATGAARLAARAALRVGAGLVTVASPQAAVATNAAHLTAIMLAPFDGADGLASILEDRRKNAVVIGPGCGIGKGTRAMVEAVLAKGTSTVLDADALTSFEDAPDALAKAIDAMPNVDQQATRAVVLTPHEGEFARVFADAPGTSKLQRARACAVRFNAIVVLKGPDTVVASPDGLANINDNAPPWLATAGSGDVLAGMIAGLLAQGMPPFEAASAAVWLHGECANAFGRGLIAEDLPETLPKVLQNLNNTTP